MTDPLPAEYQRRYEGYLQVIAANLQAHLADCIDGLANVERVIARAKDPERFLSKAQKTEGGRPKYSHPLTDIQDQVGARVIVLYERVVEPVSLELSRYLAAIEDQTLVPESHWEFGYFGRHHVFSLPPDVVPSGVSLDEAPPFFELQVKTIFQHAWSEADHDLGYKAPRELEGGEQRLLAFAAAQAWGADRAFSELLAGLGETLGSSG